MHFSINSCEKNVIFYLVFYSSSELKITSNVIFVEFWIRILYTILQKGFYNNSRCLVYLVYLLKYAHSL